MSFTAGATLLKLVHYKSAGLYWIYHSV